MKEEMHHERCSELLRPYVLGQLDERDRTAVEAHVATCSACRAELRGAEILRPQDDHGLGPREQRKLHAAVARAVEPREPVLVGPRVPGHSRWGRFAPTLTAAALLVAIAVVGLSGLGDDARRHAGGGGAESDAGAGRAGERQRGGATPAAGDEGAETGPAPAAEEDLYDALEAGDPKPEFRTTRLANRSDWATAAAGPLLEDYQDYTAEEAEEREALYLNLIAEDAPGELRDQVVSCGEWVRDQSDEPVLAAYGAIGTVDDERSLLLSFAYPDTPDGRLTDYMVWAWPLGTCSTRLDYATGELDE